MKMTTENEFQRYERQMLIEGFGTEGQKRLKKAKIIIAGAGGLGGIVAIYLTAAGVGRVRLIDHDQVELSNLNRQILYGDKDIGKKKTDLAQARLESLNREVEIEAICETITKENAFNLIDDGDLIVDALDNFQTRFILNEVAVRKRIPFFHGAIRGFEGKATTIVPGKTLCLKCLYPQIPDLGVSPVIGVAPAVIGSIQATEVIKYITGIGNLLTNRLLLYDGLNLEFTEIKLKRRQDCEVCQHLQESAI
jgi:molybdopterin/thiamine biosynthesis adenylyltransferase